MARAYSEGLARAGYQYDSSTNPCWLPGKYNNFKAERGVYKVGSITEIPASVSTSLRIPLFWLSLHLLPLQIYEWLCVKSIKKTGFLNIYFHPWEFSEYIHNKELKIPFYIRRNAGEPLVTRLARIIAILKERGYDFGTMRELVNNN